MDMDLDQLQLKRASTGDQRAFEAVIAPYTNGVYRLCLRMMGNEHDAMDMAQETLLRVWRNLSAYKGQSLFSTWLYRIATNACLDELRRRKRKEADSLELLTESGFDAIDTADTPEDALDRKLVTQQLSGAMEKLGSEHKTALLLRDVQGLSYDEIAIVLDLNLNTVKSRISRARRALKSILLKFGQQTGNFNV